MNLKIMKISTNGISLIKSFEGFASKIYDDVGHPAIGYGTDLLPEEEQKYKDKTITEEEATQLLVSRLNTEILSFYTKQKYFTER